MKHKPANLKHRRRGVALIWVGISFLVLVGFVGLALDTGFVLFTSQQLQNAADASSLAAVALVQASVPDARNAAVTTALANFAAKTPVALDLNGGNGPDGEIVVGRFERLTQIFTPWTPEEPTPNAVKVVARRTDAAHGAQPILFGPIFGVENANITTDAIAMVQGGTGAGLITLCPNCECSLQFNGNNTLVVDTTPEYDGPGAIQVNADGVACPICASGSSLTVQADEINIVDDNPPCPNGNPTIDADINPDSPVIPDPLANVPPPPLVLPDLGGIRNDEDPGIAIYPPGYYSEGIRLTSSETFVQLESGIYYLDNASGDPQTGLYVNGGNLDASAGVMFYIAGVGEGSGTGEAVVYLGGNGIITINPMPLGSGPYGGISIFQSRTNNNEATIIGTSNMFLDGTYYFPVAPLEIGGTGIALGNQLIAWTMWIHGTGEFTIAYDGSFPAPGAKVFLVE